MKRKYPYHDDGEKNQIKEALSQECSSLSPSPGIKERIDERIRESQEETESMKHLSVKKVVIGVAAACLLLSGGAYAAGHATGLVSHSSLTGQYESYDGDMDKAEKKLGFNVLTVEGFDNGYGFRSMEVRDVQGIDDQRNEVYTYKDMTVYYEKAGCRDIYLDMCRPVEEEQRAKTADATKVCGDTTLYYDEYTYKFVPADYQKTPEDEANEQRDDYYISVGSDQVEIKVSQNVTWEIDGTHYNLAGFDTGLSADELLSMAEEIIQNGQ